MSRRIITASGSAAVSGGFGAEFVRSAGGAPGGGGHGFYGEDWVTPSHRPFV